MEISNVIDDIHQYLNSALIIDGILVTIFNPRTILGQHQKKQLERIAEAMKTKVYDTVIRRCNTVSISQSDRKSVFDYATNNAATDYGNFIDEFLRGVANG